VVHLVESVALGLVAKSPGGCCSECVGCCHVVGSSCARWLGGRVLF
jgi:hypothetical protein